MNLWVLGTRETETVRKLQKEWPKQTDETQLSNKEDTATMAHGPLSCL